MATAQPTDAANLRHNLDRLDPDAHPLLRQVLEEATANRVPVNPSDLIFTDERAPVEIIVDSLVLRYLIEEGPAGLPGLAGGES